MDIAGLIRNIPDFPKPGVQFKDVTTLWSNPAALHYIVEGWMDRYKDKQIDAIVGAEARGFVFGGALAYAMNLPFIPARKKGKLPGETIQESFELEYGTDILEIHVDAIKKGDRVLLVDDLLATGGTIGAIARLVQRLGGEIEELAFVVELPLFKGREKLAPLQVHSLVEFMVE